MWSPASIGAPFLCSEIPQVVTVHDLQHLVFPKHFGRLRRFSRDWLVRASLARSQRVISISHFTADAVAKLFGLQRSRISVVHEGVSWTERPADEEIRAVLGDEAERFMTAYGVTERGNAPTGSAHGPEGKSILELKGDWEEREALARARHKLFEVRERRTHPGRDEKVLASWNGLMLAAFSEAARVLERDDYRQVAERNADFLLSGLRTPDGRLYHTWKAGEARINGYLEDHTHLIEGLLELYQTTFDARWYSAAQELAETMIAHFGALEGGFFDTSDDHETLITRPRDLYDNATPSGNGMAAFVLMRLAGLAVEPRYAELAQRSLRGVQALLARAPLGFGQWLSALHYVLSGPREIAIVGDVHAPDARALLAVASAGYHPQQIVALGQNGTEDSVVPLLRGRSQLGGQATAYVCADSTCYPPVTEPEPLRELIERRP